MRRIPFKIAFLTTGSANYYSKELGIHKEQMNGLIHLSDRLDFELRDIEPEIQTVDDIKIASEVLRDVDLLLIMCGSFSDGNIVPQISRLGKPTIFWSVPEPTDNNDIKLHSLITQVLFSSIYNKYLQKPNDYFTVYGNSTDKEFIDKFSNIVIALKTVKYLATSKICQVGSEAYGFLNLKENERSLKRKFGTKISHLNVATVVKLAKSIPENEAEQVVDALVKQKVKVEVSRDKLIRTARVYLALRQISQENGVDALAVSCWPEFQTQYQMVPCLAFSMLVENDDICVSCEGDLGGLISMMILQGLSLGKPSLMDITQVNFEKDAIQLWHCGFSPLSFAGESSRLIDHPMLNRKLSSEAHMGVSQDFIIDAQAVTFLRLTGKQHQVFVGAGWKTNEVAGGFTGVRLWLDRLRTTFGSVKTKQLIDTILKNGIEHHFAICRADVLERVSIFTKFTHISFVEWTE